MLDRSTLFKNTQKLISVLKVFEKRESKNNEDITIRNEGEISFCNIAVWLVAYQLLNKNEQEACKKEIEQKSGKSLDEVTKLINQLNNTESIKHLIELYGTKNTEIIFNKNAKDAGCLDNLNNDLKKWLEEKEILKEGGNDKLDKYLLIKNEKDIFFQWHERGFPLEEVSGQFCGKQKEYGDFIAFHADSYEANVLDFKDRKWLAIKKPTYAKSEVISNDRWMGEQTSAADQNGNAYLFTPILKEEELALEKLQENYSEILHNTDAHALYLESQNNKNLQNLKSNKDLLLANNLLEETKSSIKIHSDFPLAECKFPNLKNDWAGTEVNMALGIPSASGMFAPLFTNGPRINGAAFENIQLKCLFKVKYDEIGGQIKNEISLDCFDGMPQQKYNVYNLQIDRPFLICYEEKENSKTADIYQFKIFDPFGKQKITKVDNQGVELVQDEESKSVNISQESSTSKSSVSSTLTGSSTSSASESSLYLG